MARLSYALWTPRGGNAAMSRIYVNGLPSKVYLQKGRGGCALRAEPPHPPIEELHERVVEDLVERGVPEDVARNLEWAAVEAECGPRRGAPRSNGSGAARLSGRLSERLVNHGMDVTTIPVEEAFRIIVDHREPQLVCDELRRHPMATVEVASLEIGDFIIEANGRTVVVERKSVRDFQGSVQGGHIFDQAQRIASLGDEVIGVLLIEGETLGEADLTMLPQAMTGAITCLSLVQGLAVLQTLDAVHTAWALVKLAHHCTGLGYELHVHKSKPKQLLDARSYVLQSLPGVSGEMAKRLLEHFGSVQAVMAAEIDELLEVRGLGPKTATRIREVLAG